MIWKKETGKSLASKKLNIICFIACLLMCINVNSSLNAYADEELNLFSQNGKKTVYEGCVYDADNGYYAFSLYNREDVVVYATVLDGLYTNDVVKIAADATVNYEIYRNGQQYTGIVENKLTEPGDYAIVVPDNTGKPETLLKFTILSNYSNYKRIDLPGICKIDRVVYNGDEVPTNNRYVLLDDEGEYEITYVVTSIGKYETFKINIDNTAPVLKFDGVDEKNEAHGPVTMSEIEEKCSISILRDGKEMDFTSTFDQSGRYKITIQDEATNEAVYEFTIFPYYNFSSFLFIGLCIFVLSVIVMYVFFVRKHLRVR